MVHTATMTKPGHKTETSIAVSQLDLTLFRNYPSLRLTLPDANRNLVVLSGENGAGKTNLLEAISYLGPGRGLRGARLTDITHNAGPGPWAVSGTLVCDGKNQRIGCAIDYGKGSGGEANKGRARRYVMVDDERFSSASSLAPYLSVIWLTPRMDRLFQNGASERRRFFDQLVTGLFPEHASQISAYEKTMRERLRLLVDGGGHGDEAWLAAIERRMAEYATALAATRLEALQILKANMKFKKKSLFPVPVIALEGDMEDLVSTLPALEAEEKFTGLLKKARRVDGYSGRTTKGPHKTDLVAWHPLKSMPAGQCSTGEQKAMLIALIFGAVRSQISARGRAPLLLLDELAAHLDEERRRALFEEISDFGIQTWMTGTDAGLFAPLKGQATFFHVEDGTLAEMKNA